MNVRDALTLAQVIDDATPQTSPNITRTNPYALTPAPAGTAVPGTSAPNGMAPAAVGNCYRGQLNNIQFSIPLVGTNVFSIGAGITGFCDGPGNQAIVSTGNRLFPDLAQFPGVCVSDQKTYHGGEGTFYGKNSTFVHLLTTTSAGEGVNGACVAIRSVSAAFRFDSLGYADCYNDWGFGGNYGCGTLTVEQGPY